MASSKEAKGNFEYDLFVIGAGSGGVRASRVAASHGARVAIAEEFRVGGTCVIRGCVPKKMLVYGAHFAEDLVDAQRFGWDIGEPRFDWITLRDTVLSDVSRLEELYGQTLSNNDVELFQERVELVGPHEVRLASGRSITADTILIATGARPHADPSLSRVPGAPTAHAGDVWLLTHKDTRTTKRVRLLCDHLRTSMRAHIDSIEGRHGQRAATE